MFKDLSKVIIIQEPLKLKLLRPYTIQPKRPYPQILSEDVINKDLKLVSWIQVGFAAWDLLHAITVWFLVGNGGMAVGFL